MKTISCTSNAIVGCVLLLFSSGYAGYQSSGKTNQDRDTVFLKDGEVISGSICAMKSNGLAVRDIETGLRRSVGIVEVERIVYGANHEAPADAVDHSIDDAGQAGVPWTGESALILPSQTGLRFGIGPRAASQIGGGMTGSTGYGGMMFIELQPSGYISFMAEAGYTRYPVQDYITQKVQQSSIPIYLGIRAYFGGPTFTWFVGTKLGVELMKWKYSYYDIVNPSRVLNSVTYSETDFAWYPELGVVFNPGGPVSVEFAAGYHVVNMQAGTPFKYFGASLTIRFQLPW